MRKSSFIRIAAIVTVGVLTPHFSRADISVDRIMSSYVIAKADVVPTQSVLTESEMKAYPFSIQVASYINEKDALSHVEELRAQEKEAKYYPTYVRGQVWYKVCVGKFTTKEEAETYKKSFVKRTDEPFAVVISWLERNKGPADLRHESSPAADLGSPSKVEKSEKSEKITEKKRRPASATVAVKAETDESPLAPVKAFEAMAKTKAKEAFVEKKEFAGDVATGSYYSLQIGAYPTEALAKESAAKVKDGEVSLRQARVNGQEWYRVYVGKFKSKKEAEDFQQKLAGQESFVRKVNDLKDLRKDEKVTVSK